MLFPRESLGRFPDRDAPIPSSATSTNSVQLESGGPEDNFQLIAQSVAGLGIRSALTHYPGYDETRLWSETGLAIRSLVRRAEAHP